MKWFIGIVLALIVLGLFVGIPYMKHQQQIRQEQAIRRMARLTERMKIENDEAQVENDRIEVRIAELEGRNLKKAKAKLQMDQSILNQDRMTQKLNSNLEELGDALGH
jgi:Na+-transporting NADH:ubiquinone oxidoreductase subunit NqrC